MQHRRVVAVSEDLQKYGMSWELTEWEYQKGCVRARVVTAFILHD